MASEAILEKKKIKIKEFKEIFKSNGIYLFDYRGLSVGQFEKLRHKVKVKNGNCRVIKNSIAARFFEEEKIQVDDQLLKGPIAILYGTDKVVEIAKVLVDFVKDMENVEIKSGFLDQEFINKDKIYELSKLPGRDQLVSQLLMTIAMPLKKFGMTLSSPLKNMLLLMNNLKGKKEKEESKNG